MKGVRKILVFFLSSVLLCIGIQGKAFQDVDPMKSLFAHELLERNENHESKTFSDPASEKQDITDHGFHGFRTSVSDEFVASDKDDGVNDNDDNNDVKDLSDDLPENEMNTNEEYDDDDDDDDDDDNDDYNDDGHKNYGDVNDDDDDVEDLSDDLPENEINTNEEYDDDNDDYNYYIDHDDDYYDDDDNVNDDNYNDEENLSDDLPENEINTSEEYDIDDDYNEDDENDDENHDIEDDDDDFYNNGGDLKEDLPENEIFYTHDEDDNDDDYDDDYENEDEVNVDNRKYLPTDDPLKHVMSSDEGKDTDSQRYEDESRKDKISFIFEDNPDMSASDVISTINQNSGTVDKADTYEGDIIVDRSRKQEVAEWTAEIDGSKRSVENINSKRAVVNRNYRWPGKTFVYRFDSGYFGGDEFNKALQEYMTNTCIRFRRITGLTPYHARIFRGQGCYSYVGYIRRRQGSQDVSIGNGCNYKGIIIHEIMHALGFWHEQSRHDRDNYVTILWNNIQQGRENNFAKHTNSKEETERLRVAYDYNSVMHYGATAFARQRGLKTIVRKDDPNGPLGQRRGLSPFDIQELNRYYECTNTPVTTRRPTTTPKPPTTTRRPPTPTTARPIVLNFGTFIYVYIKSVGCRDPGAASRCTEVDATIRVNNQEYPFGSYGATVVVIDGITGKVEGSYNEQTSDIGRRLRTLGEKKLVLISVKGTWRRRSRSLRSGLRKMGLNWRRSYYYLGSYAAISWSGPGKISVTKEVFASRRRGPSVISRFIVFPLI